MKMAGRSELYPGGKSGCDLRFTHWRSKSWIAVTEFHPFFHSIDAGAVFAWSQIPPAAAGMGFATLDLNAQVLQTALCGDNRQVGRFGIEDSGSSRKLFDAIPACRSLPAPHRSPRGTKRRLPDDTRQPAHSWPRKSCLRDRLSYRQCRVRRACRQRSHRPTGRGTTPTYFPPVPRLCGR